MKTKTPTHPITTLGAVAAAVLLAACDGSSSDSGADPRLEAQAIDGYLFDSQVLCDDVETGRTGLAGRFDCPIDTRFFAVSGGFDVGFDESASTGEPFIGRLAAPASLSYVTPLSTLAVDMSRDENGNFDESLFERSVGQIAAVLGQSDLDLDVDPTDAIQLARINAQINALVAEFGDTGETYVQASRTFAAIIRSAADAGAQYDLVVDVSNLVDLVNAGLVTIDPDLGKSDAERAAIVDRVQTLNARIATATSANAVTAVVAAARPPEPVLTIDRNVAAVRYGTTDDAGLESITLAGFESDEQSGESIATSDRGSFDAYQTILTGDTDRLEIGQEAFDVRSSLSGATVQLGFELDATSANDPRYFSVTTAEATLATNATTDAMTLSIASGSTLTVRAIDENGTVTNSTVTLGGDYEFSSANEGINVSFWDIDEQLDDEGFESVADEAGNFRLTAVIGGVRIGEVDMGELVRASLYTVTTDTTAVSGVGFRGYVTFEPPADR